MLTNILDMPLIGTLARSEWFWRLVRLMMLALLLSMIAFGWHQHAIPGVDVRDPLMYTNFATFNLWVLWMMGMVVVAMLLGRSWCTVCPVGWLNGIVSRYGLRRDMPDWLQNFLPVTLLLVLLQLLVYFFAIHRYPDHTAVLLAWMLVLAVAAGLFFRRRSFCLLFCPAGAVFSLYARLAPWQLRVKSQPVCEGCVDKPCIATGRMWKQAELGDLQLTWRTCPEGCPVGLVPAEINNSADCTLCLNCLQTCCNDNIALGVRSWPGDLRQEGLRLTETLFFVVLLGLLTANFAKVHVALREMIFWLPENLALSLGWNAAGFYPLAVLWVSLLFPLLLLTPGMIVYLLGNIQVSTHASKPDRRPEREGSSFSCRKIMHLLGRMAPAVLPLVISAHLCLALVKLNAKLGYLPLTLQDPTGVKSFLAINIMQTLSPPGVLISLDILKWLVIAILIAGVLFSLWAAGFVAKKDGNSEKLDRPLFFSILVSLVLLTGLYGSTVIEWLFVR